MTIMKKIRPYIFAAGILAYVLTGSGTTLSAATQQFEQKDHTNIYLDNIHHSTYKKSATVEEVMNILNIDDPDKILNFLPNGYKSLKSEEKTLYILAGIYAGTAKIEKINNIPKISGYYNKSKNPEALEKVLLDADVDFNKVVTGKELEYLEKKIYK